MSIREMVAMLRRGDLLVSDLVARTLDAVSSLNPEINAFVQVWGEDALERAAAADADPALLGPLGGIPSGDKDLVHRAGYPTRFGSAATASWPIPQVSDPMAQWLDRSGAISVGKTATSEFGLAGYTETVEYGPTRNPHHLSHGVGGSSGGAAAAVASGIVAFAPGSDGGGSIRIPALACGVVGLKPSRGRVPAQSGFESLSGLVVPGVIARTVSDVSVVGDLLFHGPYHWSVAAPPLRRSLEAAATDWASPLRIGVTTTTPWGRDVDCPLEESAMMAFDKAVSALTDAGHRVEPWDWTPIPGYFEAFSVLWQASTTGSPLTVDDQARVEPLTAFLVEQGRLMRGETLVASVAWLRRFEHDTITQMADFDAILTPGLAFPAPPVGFFDPEDAEANFRQQIQFTPYTSFVNVCGLPALAVPTHKTPDGLPMGVQLIGPPGREDTVVSLGAQLENALGLNIRPAVFAS